MKIIFNSFINTLKCALEKCANMYSVDPTFLRLKEKFRNFYDSQASRTKNSHNNAQNNKRYILLLEIFNYQQTL